MRIHQASELQTLFRLRRSLILVAVSYGYFLFTLALWRRGPDVPELTKAIIGTSALLTLLGVVHIGKEFGIWLMIGSLATSVIYVTLDPLVKIAWIQLSALVAVIVIAVAFAHQKLRVWIAILLILSLAIFNFLAYNFEATSLLRSGSFLGRGVIGSSMIFGTGAYALYGWKRMVRRATSNDEIFKELSLRIEEMEIARARQNYWRKLVVRVHESTLNTIRSLLSMREIAIEELRPAIEKSLMEDQALMMRAREHRSDSVIGAIRAGIDSAAIDAKIRIISQGVNLHLDYEVAETLVHVVREALRNAMEHAGAQNIEILWRTSTESATEAGHQEHGRVMVTITDDGIVSTSGKTSGIGTTLVMSKSVRELGGTIEIEGHIGSGEVGTSVRIEMPTSLKPRQGALPEFPTFNAIQHGRYMALLTLFGPAMTGVIFFPLLSIWWKGQILAQILGFVVLLYLLNFTYIKGKLLGWMESGILATGLLGVVVSLKLEPLTCISAQPFQWVINSVVYGLFLILLWGKWQVIAGAYPLFLYLVAPSHSLIPDNCNFIFNFPLLNTLFSFLFVASIFTLVYKAFVRVERFQESRRLASNSLVTEIKRGDVAFNQILELDTLARKTMVDLASKSGPISSETQEKLRRIESELRAEIQVDPVTSSGLTILAVDFVRKVVANNRWIEVRSIHGDENSHPIPELVREQFLAIAQDLPSGASIQLVGSEHGWELSVLSHSEIPDSVGILEKSVRALSVPGLTCSVNSMGDGEFAIFLKREKQFR